MEVFRRNLDLDMFYKNNIYTMYENIQLNEFYRKYFKV